MNQVPPLEDVNVFLSDRALGEAVAAFAPGAPHDDLERVGALAGSAGAIALGFEANENPPRLVSHDSNGNRIDDVRFHPSWHRLLEHATSFGLAGAAWHSTQASPHLMRSATFYVWSQAESGHGCPISMTHAAVPTLRKAPELAALWESRLCARAYDPRLVPVASKSSALCGMAMTEKQGGSDVRANATRAVPLGRNGSARVYALTGEKWFCSAPASDAFLVLAQAAGGISCFLVPRVLEDGSRNSFSIVRLKEKLGNRSNASAEIALDAARGSLVGEEGAGLGVILEMVNQTRLDCMVGSASLVRQALAQAIHYAERRRAFGALLADQPLMRNVLADIAIESEAATWLLARVARAVDDGDAPLQRIGTALGKYWICKRAPVLVGEALESLGGNGYVETSVLPRLYRESPLNSIWEGAGNINALDVLRIARKQPEALEALRAQWSAARSEPRIAAAIAEVDDALADEDSEERARFVAERAATLWQAALLLVRAPAAVAETFLRSRVAREGGRGLGTLPRGCDVRSIVERASPHPAKAVA